LKSARQHPPFAFLAPATRQAVDRSGFALVVSLALMAFLLLLLVSLTSLI